MPLSVNQQRTAVLFLAVSAVDIIAILGGWLILHNIAKPLLVPLLISILILPSSKYPGKNLLLAGLFFSWIGDLLLLFDKEHPIFFIFGLASFLTTHIFYIIFFLLIPSGNRSLLTRQPLLVILVLAYGTALVWLLFPHLGDLKLPVMAYAAVICTMLLCSLHAFTKINPPANRWFLCGALAFVLSDSLLALDKFYQPLSFAGVLIMLTYCAAQYGIVRGYLESTSS